MSQLEPRRRLGGIAHGVITAMTTIKQPPPQNHSHPGTPFLDLVTSSWSNISASVMDLS